MNHELAKTLTTALVQFIDENRPEGTMCCSSGECVSLEKAFTEENFDSVEGFIQKKLSRLTEFEKALAELVNDVLTKEPQNPFVWIVGSGWGDRLLSLAKKELLKDGWHKVFSEEVKTACTNKCPLSSDFEKFLSPSNN